MLRFILICLIILLNVRFSIIAQTLNNRAAKTKNCLFDVKLQDDNYTSSKKNNNLAWLDL